MGSGARGGRGRLSDASDIDVGEYARGDAGAQPRSQGDRATRATASHTAAEERARLASERARGGRGVVGRAMRGGSNGGGVEAEARDFWLHGEVDEGPVRVRLQRELHVGSGAVVRGGGGEGGGSSGAHRASAVADRPIRGSPSGQYPEFIDPENEWERLEHGVLSRAGGGGVGVGRTRGPRGARGGKSTNKHEMAGIAPDEAEADAAALAEYEALWTAAVSGPSRAWGSPPLLRADDARAWSQTGGGGAPAPAFETDGWDYDRLLALDDAIVRNNGMPPSAIRRIAQFRWRRGGARVRVCGLRAGRALILLVRGGAGGDRHGVDCSVCIESFVDTDVCFRLRCGHVFHRVRAQYHGLCRAHLHFDF